MSAEYELPTPGRMPVISFSDDASHDTLMSVLTARAWCVALVLKDGTHPVEVLVEGYDIHTDLIGGKTFDHDANDWTGEEFYVPLDDVVQIIIL
jgi:hypothetical protein